MTAEKETLRRIQDGLFHLRKGLAPFVEARMKRRHGPDWLRHASRARGGSPVEPLDAYGLLKTMLDNWREVFDEVFVRDQRYRVRNFASMAFEARNAVYHASRPLEDDAALRYLDAMLQLLKVVNAPNAEVAELTGLYSEQRRSGIEVSPVRAVVRPTKSGQTLTIGRARSNRTIEDRLFDYVRSHPDLDDDELSIHLGIRPRQSINQAARRLEAAGRLRRVVGPRGKIVNRAQEPKS
jgi:hypothetical protein